MSNQNLKKMVIHKFIHSITTIKNANLIVFKKYAFIVIISICTLQLSSCKQNNKSENVQNQLGPAPGNYTIENDRDKIILPFEYYGMNLMVKSKMNGKEINMLIDNGVMWDELLFYGSPLIDSLGMKYEGEVRVDGAGDDMSKGTDSYTASGVSLSFGDITFYDQEAVITPKGSGWAEMFPGMAGQVCGAFFKHFVTEFDFDNNMLILHKPESFKYKGKGRPIKMTRDEGGGYAIPVKLKLKGKDEIDYNLSIDLGSIDPVYLVISEKYNIDKPNSKKIYIGHGASGEITGYKEYLESFTIGGYEMNNVLAVLTESEDDGNHTNTTLGLPLLNRFNVVFDYFNETLYLEPNSKFNGSD